MLACASGPSCLGRSRLLVVMPTVAGLLLLFQLLQALGFAVAQAALAELPVILAVLVDQAHLRLAQDGQEVLVLTRVWSPGAGLQGGQGRAAGLHQHVVDRATGEDHQLELDQGVFEVLLCGRALVDAAVGGLQRADEEAVLCLQDAALGADLHGRTTEDGFKNKRKTDSIISCCQLT